VSATTAGPADPRPGALVRLREAAGLTQEDLAQRSGVSVRSISDIERGEVTRPRRRTLEALADAMNITPDQRQAFLTLYRPSPQPDAADVGGQLLQPGTPDTPAQLPLDVSGFVGRQDGLQQLTTYIADGNRPTVVTVIDGPAGVGKTALAVHWAHQVKHRFPDGQLFVNLHGFGPLPPREPADLLEQLLRALGVASMPADLESRSALLRTRLAGRRVLLLLDNVRDPGQVRPLLPASPGSVVLVTSRSRMAGLVAHEGAHRLSLDPLNAADAGSLLQGRAAATPADPNLQAVIDRCAGLPLALRIVGERLETGYTLQEAAADLALLDHRLDVVATGDDEHTSTRTVLSWSYDALPPITARVFRLLGLHHGTDIDAAATAALTDLAPATSQAELERLLGWHLVERHRPGRYEFHDLLRAFAHELTSALDDDAVRRDAVTRVLDHYRETATEAMDTAYPYERHRRPGARADATSTQRFATADQAVDWLNAESANIIATCRAAATLPIDGRLDMLRDLAKTLVLHLGITGRRADALTLYRDLADSAERAGDRAAHGDGLHGMATNLWRLGRYREALAAAEQALSIRLEIDDRNGVPETQSIIGILHWTNGRGEQAYEYHRRSRLGYQQLGDRLGEARAFDYLGLALRGMSRFAEAIENHEQAIAIYRSIDDPLDEAMGLVNLGDICRQIGRSDDAVRHQRRAVRLAGALGGPHEAVARSGLGIALSAAGEYAEALDQLGTAREMHRAIADRAGEAESLAHIGIAQYRSGDHDAALDSLRHAVNLSRETDTPLVEVEALNALGQVLRARGDLAGAGESHRRAETLAHRIGDRYQAAASQDGLAETAHQSGDHATASALWQQALATFRELGVPEAQRIEAHLTNIDVG
jgi:tetratricopeptide (TPR) repeat protein/transcriptional regulator with XRE-family HTH domain